MNQATRIVLDAMGGDRAPAVPVQAAWLAAARGLEVELVGPQEILEQRLQEVRAASAQLTPGKDAADIATHLQIVPASEWITMDEHPVEALRRKPQASLLVAARRVAADPQKAALVSAGNTGAVLAATLFTWKRLPGIERPALGTFLPTARGGRTLLVDAGANVDCRPLQLVQFAAMGWAFVQALGVSQPAGIGLLNIGAEPGKGNEVAQKTFLVLQSSGLPFAGNVEGMDVWSGKVAVVVCDGFVGNVLIKSAEGLVDALLRVLSHAGPGQVRTPADSPAGSGTGHWSSVLQAFDWNEIGGAPLLGLNGVGIVAHGRSSPKALLAAMELADRLVREALPARLGEALDNLRHGADSDARRESRAAAGEQSVKGDEGCH
ncbi:MAG: phosphate acyltransferase PlsX [Limnochordaceae bacterium]|nr:phosphate acyltransferase PlsX [Limnochordaceae bacterium]